MMAGPAAMIGMGASVLGGVTGAVGAGVSAQGQINNIRGQMLQTVAQAFGQQVQAQQYDYSAQVADYQAAVADMNAKIAMTNKNWELATTEVKAQQSGMQTRANLSGAIATQGASGISVDSKTFAGVRQSIIELGAYDEATIRADGARKAYAFDIEASQDTAQANLFRYTSAVNTVQAGEARTAAGMTMQALPLQERAIDLASEAGTLGMISSLTSGAASVSSKWLSPSNPLTT